MSELNYYKLFHRASAMTSPQFISVVEFGNGDEVYLKSEADKVIAELELQLAKAQLVLRLNKPEALYTNLEIMSRLNHKIYVVERRELHQKYKRCLAMANYWVAVSYQCVDDKHRQRAERNHYKWLEIAEKFKDKEAK